MTSLMFTGVCCAAVDASNAAAVILTEDVNSEMPAADCYDIYEEPDIERIRQLFAGERAARHHHAGLATRVAWSPDSGPSSPAWCLVTVERDHRARLAVRRLDEDEKWTLIDFEYAPWFAASSAGALRKWLDGDFSSPIRYGGDPRLFEQVRKLDTPPAHEDGKL